MSIKWRKIRRPATSSKRVVWKYAQADFGKACSLIEGTNWDTLITVDREIFTLKIIRVKNFRVNKFSRFRSIRDIFLTVNGYSMDKHLESS